MGFILLAIGILAVGFRSGSNDGTAQNILDSPEASGRMLGILIPVALFGAIGFWFLFSKNRAA